MMVNVTAGSLTGIKVVDASRVLAGPFCAQMLGDHGAQVIKVEAPSGDECRDFGPPFVNGSSAYFNAVNRNKRGLVLDLRLEEDRKRFLDLVSEADVLIENFKVSTLKSWGIDSPAYFTSLNERLVHCRITGFGDDGPYGGLPGYDAAVQAMAGLMSINGDGNGPPLRLGVPIVDLATGMNAAIATLLALMERSKSGKGQMADVSLYDTAISVAHPFLTNYIHSNVNPTPTGNTHPNIVPYNVYQTSTIPLFIAVANDRLFKILCEHLAVPEVATDERFSSNRKRVENRDALERILAAELLKHEGEAFGEALLNSGVPAAPILDIEQVAKSEHTKHREMVENGDHYQGPGIPIKLLRTPGSIRRGAPPKGEYQPSSIKSAFSPQSFDKNEG